MNQQLRVSVAKIAPFLVLGVFALPQSARSEQAGLSGGQDVRNALNKLRSPDEREREEGVRAMRVERTAAVLGLQWIIRERRRDPEAHRYLSPAMRLLGELRAKEAVGTLIENLEFTAPSPVGVSGPTLDPLYSKPQLRALIEIGMPAVDPLLKRVQTDPKPIIIERAAIVVREVLGPTLATHYVKERQSRQDDEGKRQALDRLLEKLAAKQPQQKARQEQ